MAAVICISIVVVLFLVSSAVLLWHHKKEKKNKYELSFRESMDLTNLPVITFTNNGVKLNFLLDTGSDESYINKRELKKLKYDELNIGNTAIGVEGKEVHTRAVRMEIECSNLKFNDMFFSMDLSKSFDNIKRESGVAIHGILGAMFFRKYRYVLDFDKLKVKLK